ncbi:MAG: hypothetical protein ACD_62C00395G0002 [uncultured bacterium]|nr:MAG: hypothetical protein ACD_62C00395G0002 [uncultured bacterium]
MNKERIQKVIAASGQFSRRAVERLIEERKIKVNGILITSKGVKVDPLTDHIQILGKAFKPVFDQETIAILFHKPRHVIVTRKDEENRKTIFHCLPEKFHTLKPVGRLDYNTQGALILSNDGELILKLTHPRYHLDKVYQIKTTSPVEEKMLKRLERGVIIDGERTLPAKITVLRKHETSAILQFVLQEGKNRQIRRMCETVGISVKELKRVAIGPVKLGSLRSGEYRYLTRKELKILGHE